MVWFAQDAKHGQCIAMEIFDLRDLRLYKVLGANTKQCQEVSRGLKGVASQAKRSQGFRRSAVLVWRIGDVNERRRNRWCHLLCLAFCVFFTYMFLHLCICVYFRDPRKIKESGDVNDQRQVIQERG